MFQGNAEILAGSPPERGTGETGPARGRDRGRTVHSGAGGASRRRPTVPTGKNRDIVLPESLGPLDVVLGGMALPLITSHVNSDAAGPH